MDTPTGRCSADPSLSSLRFRCLVNHDGVFNQISMVEFILRRHTPVVLHDGGALLPRVGVQRYAVCVAIAAQVCPGKAPSLRNGAPTSSCKIGKLPLSSSTEGRHAPLSCAKYCPSRISEWWTRRALLLS